MPLINLEGNALLYTVTLLTCLSFLLIGFDNGLMGGFSNGTPFLDSLDINIDTNAGVDIVALIVAIYEVGCFFGAITTSFVGEPLGRRKTIFIGVIIMIIGKVCRFISYIAVAYIVIQELYFKPLPTQSHK